MAHLYVYANVPNMLDVAAVDNGGGGKKAVAAVVGRSVVVGVTFGRPSGRRWFGSGRQLEPASRLEVNVGKCATDRLDG